MHQITLVVDWYLLFERRFALIVEFKKKCNFSKYKFWYLEVSIICIWISSCTDKHEILISRDMKRILPIKSLLDLDSDRIMLQLHLENQDVLASDQTVTVNILPS